MNEDYLFSTYELRQTIQNHQNEIRNDLERIPDQDLASLDLDELTETIFEERNIEFPELLEPAVSNRRVKQQVAGYDGRTIHRDAELYLIEIPFNGESDLFLHRGSTFTTNCPVGKISGHKISYSIVTQQPDAENINREFKRFVENIERHLGFLRKDVESFNQGIPDLILEIIDKRKEQFKISQDVLQGLDFKIQSREASPLLQVPVKRKKIKSVNRPPRSKKKPEPVLNDETYEEILLTIKDMSTVLERSPKAFSEMDEETLRFQFLVPLNSQFEMDARAEVFNSKGKTDILISHNKKNIFIAECKFWAGESSLKSTIDQILSYLSWRDTKAAIILFNRNKNFSSVLSKIHEVVESHSCYIREISRTEETEFRYIFQNKDDEKREITLSILAFDVPEI